MELTNKAAYLKGLADGMNLAEKDTAEAKVLVKVLELLEELCDSVEELEIFSDEVTELVDTIDEDLGDVESIIYDVDPDEDDDEDEDDEYVDLYDEDEDEADESDFDESEQDYEYEVTCPSCNNTVILPESIIMEGQSNCPNCGELLEFDLSEEE